MAGWSWWAVGHVVRAATIWLADRREMRRVHVRRWSSRPAGRRRHERPDTSPWAIVSTSSFGKCSVGRSYKLGPNGSVQLWLRRNYFIDAEYLTWDTVERASCHVTAKDFPCVDWLCGWNAVALCVVWTSCLLNFFRSFVDRTARSWWPWLGVYCHAEKGAMAGLVRETPTTLTGLPSYPRCKVTKHGLECLSQRNPCETKLLIYLQFFVGELVWFPQTKTCVTNTNFTLKQLFLRKMLGTRYGPVGTRFLWF